MTSSWLVLSTQWDLTSVQAALNVVISVLSTIGMWAFSRFWWQHASCHILHNEDGVPLSRLLLVSGPGEGWDVLMSLGRRLFAKENWPLLTQIFVVMCVTITSALAGPIAKASLHRGTIITQTNHQVLPALKGEGVYGAIIREDVLWNTTGRALNDANFPLDQLLDKLPTSTSVPWVYAEEEWDPTWTIQCNYTNGVSLQNVTAAGKYTVSEPLEAFPAFKDTYDPAWLNTSEYRLSSGGNVITNWTAPKQFQNVLFFVLIQSDPEAHDRMDHNNETLNLSLTVFHATDIEILYNDTSALPADVDWRPIGSASDVSYSRAECAITRKSSVLDEDRIPWPWTNDTGSIIASYSPYFDDPFTKNALKHKTVVPPTAQELVRFYQVYMATLSTYYSDPMPGVLSSVVDTVELSIAFLVVVLLLAVLTTCVTIRYSLFMRKHKIKIEEICVPDGKLDWIVHAAKISEQEPNSKGPTGAHKKHMNREYLQNSVFGQVTPADSALSKTKSKTSSFARVKSHGFLIEDLHSDRSRSAHHPTATQPDANENTDDDSRTIIAEPSSPLAEWHHIRQTSDVGPGDSTSAESVHHRDIVPGTIHDLGLPPVTQDGSRQGDNPEMSQISRDGAEEHEKMVQRRGTV
ncbi:hypothetical protein BJ166DRAFT_605284 [Pestalotiopsis sp. NC0098]|nr:hypothetical protein BJ166DRAFT_605284 [Pestalotiopsis sp. NC0098]